MTTDHHIFSTGHVSSRIECGQLCASGIEAQEIYDSFPYDWKPGGWDGSFNVPNNGFVGVANTTSPVKFMGCGCPDARGISIETFLPGSPLEIVLKKSGGGNADCAKLACVVLVTTLLPILPIVMVRCGVLKCTNNMLPRFLMKPTTHTLLCMALATVLTSTVVLSVLLADALGQYAVIHPVVYASLTALGCMYAMASILGRKQNICVPSDVL